MRGCWHRTSVRAWYALQKPPHEFHHLLRRLLLDPVPRTGNEKGASIHEEGTRCVPETWLLQRRYRNLYHDAMKTTLNLNDQLVADAKALAAQQRTSLTRLIEEGLQLRLRAQVASPRRGRVRLPVFKGRGGLVEGVNPLSNKALLEALGDDA